MEFVRRPSVLAALAAALLVLNVIALQADGAGEAERTIQDVLRDRQEELDARASGATGDDATNDGAAGDGTTADGETGGAATEGEGATGDASSDDAGGDAADGADDTDTADTAADEAGGDDDAADAARGPLAAPTTGDYTYASSGTWSLQRPQDPVSRQLPSTATATVGGGGDAWSVELVAGDTYTDRFAFDIGPANGLDWSGWELDRDFGQGASTTVYDCSGDSAYYVNDADAGRTSQHGCTSPQGLSSSGTIEYIGVEDVTLGDGTVVSADRLLYTYTLSGTGVSGDGRLDLWLDPSTGLRVREQRQIDSVSTNAAGDEFVYAEDVEFLLQSLTAS